MGMGKKKGMDANGYKGILKSYFFYIAPHCLPAPCFLHFLLVILLLFAYIIVGL